MGYSEVPCKLCGVSFNIGRIRKADEPQDAAWSPQCGEPGSRREYHTDRQNYFWYENIVSKSSIKRAQCPKEAGCRDVGREMVREEMEEGDIGDGSEDEDVGSEYVYKSEEEGEGFEFESDSDLVGDEEMLEDEDEEDGPMSDNKRQTHDNNSIHKREHDFDAPKSERDETTAETIAQASSEPASPKSSSYENFNAYWRECSILEHLAGPGCIHHGGYSGFRITAEQMKGCATVQCLVRKTAEWTPEPDDQSFELDGKYFLTGLSGHMPSRDEGGPEFVPVRHGQEDLFPDTYLFIGNDELTTPMPFHPTCFEIFNRASRLRNQGQIDIPGLAAWRNLESTYELASAFPRHPAVRKGSDQEWYHHAGDEWLGANPVLVPLLSSLLQNAIFYSKEEEETLNNTAHDPFTLLPAELTIAILALLTPTDVASLRLASCATHLPLSSWRPLVKEQMPWLWEVWDPATPSSFWALTSVSALAKEKMRREDVARELQEQHTVIKEEMPEILEAWWREHRLEDKPYGLCPPDFSLEPEQPPKMALPEENINWCRVYYKISNEWLDLPGLHNRQRIWRDVDKILERIRKLRDEGRIV